MTTPEAVTEYIRDAAFTTLNRFVALKMLEARQLVQECITKGEQSAGYKEFCGMAPGLALLPDGAGYRLYLESLFDEFSTEIKVLFDRRDAASVLWPKRQTFEALLNVLNAADLSLVWGEDETIGWVYQFFNSSEERKQMRDESQSPRNSRELAVRNQFFTPRYVVQFLVDNTLGRMWLEMHGEATAIRKYCNYLLQNKETEKEFRAKKDPRDLRILDPACGSGHFLLYSFDLLLNLYEEAWAMNDLVLKSQATGRALREDFPKIEALRKAVPKLIVEFNLHGVDIDPRCSQIAVLALWLRAQRAWKDYGISAADRPRIERTHIVVAEPIPGDTKLVEEFSTRLDPPLLRDLFKKMVSESSMAGELGTLLRIEDAIAVELQRAREQFQRQRETTGFLPGLELPVKQGTLNLSGIDDDQFFYEAEKRIIEELRGFAESTSGSSNLQRRLFAGDSAQGIALIDIVRSNYDIILMNPPFGYPSEVSKKYVDENYPAAKYDLLAAFIDRAFERLHPNGYVGCISSRTAFFIEYFAEWRENIFKTKGMEVFADLGFGVLDALVETAAFTIRNSKIEMPATFIRLLSSADKASALMDVTKATAADNKSSLVFSEFVKDFLGIDSYPMAYWVPKSFRDHFSNHKSVKTAAGEVRVGLQTGDDFRFIRTAWEVDAKTKGANAKWVPLAKGGEYRKFYDDIHLLVNWDKAGSEIIHLVDERGKQRSRPQNISCYYRPGLTYPMRTTSNYSPRLLPAGCIFNVQGNSIFAKNDDTFQLLVTLAVLSTSTFESFTRLKSRVGDMTSAGGAGFAYTPGLIGSMPFPEIALEQQSILATLAEKCIRIEQSKDTTDETSAIFIKPKIINIKSSLRDYFALYLELSEDTEVVALDALMAMEDLVQSAYGFTQADVLEVQEQFGLAVAAYTDTLPIDLSNLERLYLEGICVGEAYSGKASQQRQLSSNRHLRIDEICRVAQISPRLFTKLRREHRWIRDGELINSVVDIISYAVGVAFGRWDVRYATGLKPDPQLPDLFDPLPICSPGQLSNADGHFAGLDDNEEIADQGGDKYPVSIAWGGLLVDDPSHSYDIEGRVEKVLQLLWKDKYGSIMQEVCDLLGVNSLREYLRKPSGFFNEHLKRYSKSRRQAPIYWALSTASSSYTIWLYYHRLSADTLYQAATLLKDKIVHEERILAEMNAVPNPSTVERKNQLTQLSFVTELREFHDEISRVVSLWSPNLDDGVLINHSLLWRMVAHRSWKTALQDSWDELCSGKYDWSNLAMHLWPERVLSKCVTDRSLAIAHGIVNVFWTEYSNGKSISRKVETSSLAAILAERNSVAVKAALAELIDASSKSRSKKRTRRLSS